MLKAPLVTSSSSSSPPSPPPLTPPPPSSIDRNLKSHPKQFWKSISTFWKKNADLIYLGIDNIFLNKPCDIAFSQHLPSAYSGSCSGHFSSLDQCMDSLSLAPISNSIVQNAIKQL
jgi:hypothetical protein